MVKKIRSSNIEVLRIFAMILIVLSHCANYICNGNAWINNVLRANLLTIQFFGGGTTRCNNFCGYNRMVFV